MNKNKKSAGIKFFFFTFFILLFLISYSSAEATPLVGWLWGGSNDGIINTGLGWISVNRDTSGAGGGNYDYQLDLPNASGPIERYAWSSNVGWIDFQPGGSPPFGSAAVSLANGFLQGWASVVGIAGQSALNNSGDWDGWIYSPGGSNIASGDGAISAGADTVLTSGSTITFSRSAPPNGSASITINGIDASGGGPVNAEINCVKTDNNTIIFTNSDQDDCMPKSGTDSAVVTLTGATATGGLKVPNFFNEFEGSGNIMNLKKGGLTASISIKTNGGVQTTFAPSGTKWNRGLEGFAWSGEFSSPLEGLGWIEFDPDLVNIPAPNASINADPPWVIIGPDESVPINKRIKLTWSASAAPGGDLDYCTAGSSDPAWNGPISPNGTTLVSLYDSVNSFVLQCWNGPSYNAVTANVNVYCNQRYCENSKCVEKRVAVETWDDTEADGVTRKCFENCTNDLQCQNFEWREKAPN